MEHAEEEGQYDLEGKWMINISDAKSEARRFGFITLSFNNISKLKLMRCIAHVYRRDKNQMVS